MGLLLLQENDASVAMAEHISGDEETFSIYMNQLAENLGMNNTSYANSTGLPDDDLFTTARDISLLARSLIKTFPKEYKLYSKKNMYIMKLSNTPEISYCIWMIL